MNIVVTGGLGFIGHNVVRYLEGHSCSIIDNHTDYGFIPSAELNYLISERKSRVTSLSYNIDIRNYSQLKATVNILRPDVIIHLASFPRQKVVNTNPMAGSEVMVTGLVNLLEIAKQCKVGKFVYISSSMVYGDFQDNVREDAVCNPQGQYGILKLTGEWLVRDYARQGHFDYTIVRPSAVYGPHDVDDRVISKFILGAMRDQTIKVNGPEEKLDFTYVDDVARGIAQASTSSSTSGKTYNITRGESHSLLSAANLIVDIVGTGSVMCQGRDMNFPSRGSLCIDAAQRDFNYSPQINIQEGFIRYHNWLKESAFWQQQLLSHSLV